MIEYSRFWFQVYEEICLKYSMLLFYKIIEIYYYYILYLSL